MFWKKKDTFWSVRKLLMNHALLHFPQTDCYTTDDLRFDFALDSKRGGPDSAAEVLREIMTFEDIGITITDILPAPGFFELLKAVDGSKQIYTPETILFTRKQLSSLPETAFSMVAPHIRFRLLTEAKKQAKAERAYLEKYQTGRLVSNNKRPVLGYDFTEKLFEYFIMQMVKRQGRRFQIEFAFGSLKTQPQLIQAFDSLAPDECHLWQAGKLRLRLAEHLLVWIVLKEQLQIEGFTLTTNPAEMTTLSLYFPARKPALITPRTSENDRIRVVEVLESKEAAKSFTVYLNQDYLRPLTFRKSTKTGRIIYTLAEEGSIGMKGLEKIFDYFRQYERFSFYKQRQYAAEPVLEKWIEEDGAYIIPHSEVEFLFITEKDIQ